MVSRENTILLIFLFFFACAAAYQCGARDMANRFAGYEEQIP